MPSAMNSSAASAARPIALGDIGSFLRLEPRQHVIREVAPRISAPDADPQPRKVIVPSDAMIDFRPLCPPADPAGRARNRPSSSCTSSTTTSRSGELDLVEPQQLADRLAAEVHERQRLGQQTRRSAPPVRDERLGRAAPTSQSSPMPSAPARRRRRTRRCAACPRTARPGLPRPTIELHESASFRICYARLLLSSRPSLRPLPRPSCPS